MLERLALLKTVSRPEFLPANIGSLAMGLAWGFDRLAFNMQTLALTILSFFIITVVSAIGAQLNTLGDHELDSKEPRKRYLVEATNQLGTNTLKTALIIELIIAIALVVPFLLFATRPALLLCLWLGALFLTFAYNVPPLRLKTRSWLAMLSLTLVLSILPVTFVYLTVASQLDLLFALFLAGQSITVYAIIIPTETRDYFSDKAGNVRTLTVALGLTKATSFAMTLLTAGAVLMVAAFMLTLVGTQLLLLAFLLAIFVADAYVFGNFRKLHTLSSQYEHTNEGHFAEEIVELSTHNPKWITLVSQSIVLMSVVLLVSKLLF
jgi:4-hydroxybenzoate polyprenyltransferase